MSKEKKYCELGQHPANKDDFYRSIKLPYCKYCLAKDLNIHDINTILPILEKINKPWNPYQWYRIVESYESKPQICDITRKVLGRYLAVMSLKGYRDYTYADTDLFVKDYEERVKKYGD